jgi:UDP-glucose 4-epimerase
LVERLVAEGHEVDVVDDLSTGHLSNLAAARRQREGTLRVHTVDVQVEQFATLVALRRPAVIVHLAARDRAPVAERAAVATGGTASVLEAARTAGVGKVVLTASAHVYGPATARDLPLREKHPHGPTTVAGVLGVQQLSWLSLYRHVHQLEYTALILASVYGARSAYGLVSELSNSLEREGRMVVTDGGRQVRDLIYIDDVVDALVRATTRGSGVAMNVASGQPVSVRSLAEQIAALKGVAAPMVNGLRPIGDPDRLVLDPGRARIHLGWEPFTPLAEGLRYLLDPVS